MSEWRKYICRQEAIDYVERIIYVNQYYHPNSKSRNVPIDEVIDRIKQVPVADVAPIRHGEFIGTEFDGYADGKPVYYEWKCSACGCIFEDEEPAWNFCPCCGAKMDGGAE